MSTTSDFRVTVDWFNAKYPKRLKLLADRAIITVYDGVAHTRSPWPGALRLRAYFEAEDDRGMRHYPTRVQVLPTQTEASLMRILYAMFTEREARLISLVWGSPIFTDATAPRSFADRLRSHAAHVLHA